MSTSLIQQAARGTQQTIKRAKKVNDQREHIINTATRGSESSDITTDLIRSSLTIHVM